MPYLRPGSRFYQCRRRALPGYGDTGQLSSRVTSKRVARRMEALLEEIAERALVEPRWTQLLDAVCAEQTITLPELLRAKSQRRLPDLLQQLHDPPLTEVVSEYRARFDVSRQHGIGLDKLLAYAAPGAKLSWLCDAKVIRELCLRYEAEGLKRNSVIRQFKQAVSKLLRHELGNARRNAIFAEVNYSKEDDTREVHLSRGEIRRLLDCAEDVSHETYVIVLTGLLTGADRGMLVRGPRSDGFARGLLAKDLQLFEEEDGTYTGTMYVHDTKTTSRPRTVPFGDRLARELLLLVRDKAPEEAVFSIDYRGFDYVWRQARQAAGLMRVRFKDLRAQAVQYAERAGIPLTVTAATVGHSDISTTRRYARHAAVMTAAQVRDLETAMLGQTGS